MIRLLLALALLALATTAWAEEPTAPPSCQGWDCVNEAWDASADARARLAEEARKRWEQAQAAAADARKRANAAVAKECAEHPERCAEAREAAARALQGGADVIDCADDMECLKRNAAAAQDTAEEGVQNFGDWLRQKANQLREK